MYNELLAERASEFDGIKDKISLNLNKLLYNFKTEGCSWKDFTDYQMLR